MTFNPNRRIAIKSMIGATIAISTSKLFGSTTSTKDIDKLNILKGNINHSVCRGFGGMSLEELCVTAKQIGIKGIDLIGPKDWPILQKHGLDSPMCNGAEINLTDGFNHPEFHDQLIKNYSEMIPVVAKAGYKKLICFSGSRRGLDDETGLKNCVTGLKKIIGLAEKHNVVLVMELLNSKIDHKDYQCDRTHWGAELAKQLGFENFKLLFDIYHVQINEGDIIRNIQEYHSYIAHYHTAGVPGRHDIDDTQELYYPAIMRAIKDTGFKGFVAQEFSSLQKNKAEALKKAIKICDV